MRTRPRSSAAMRRSFWLSISALLALAAQAGVTKGTTGAHPCFVSPPPPLRGDKPVPLLMLFHGSGRDGMSQINEWRKLADSEGIVLVAPNATNTRQWSMSDDGPDL